MSHLRLINLYKHPLKLQFNFDVFYETPNADKLYRHQDDYNVDGSPAYRTFKHMNRAYEDAQRLSAKLEGAKEVLEKKGITDYSAILSSSNKIEFFFKSREEQAEAASVLVPNQIIEFPFLKATTNISPDRLEEIRDALQKSYDNVDLESAQLKDRVQLRADFKRSAIHAKARAIDIPRVLFQAKLFQQALKNF